MPLPYASSQIPTSFATCSIGHHPSHTLPLKLKAISDAGFDGIELSMPDILSYGVFLGLPSNKSNNNKNNDDKNNGNSNEEPAPDDYDTLVQIAKKIKEQCIEHGLKILMLQPFANFEGWEQGSKERKKAFERAEGWFRIMQACGTDMLQVGSSDSPGIHGRTFTELAKDLGELADLAREFDEGFRICYENWCWATEAPDWKDVWEIVRIADRGNLGLCLDTFQSAGGEWADPTTKSGVLEGLSDKKREERWKSSLEELGRIVPADKIYLLQISDAYKMDPPIEDKVDKDGLRPRGQWSHDYRPLPYDGGYLPVADFLNAVLATGFRGWLSMEVFDGKVGNKYEDMGQYAKTGMAALERLLKE